MIQNVLEVGVACIYSLSIFKVDHALLLMFISVFINVCAHVCVCVQKKQGDIGLLALRTEFHGWFASGPTHPFPSHLWSETQVFPFS